MLCKRIKLWPERSDVTLTTYLPDDSPVLLAGKPRPAVIICPGGAYQFCADSEAEPAALQFVAMGYHAFVLRYSTYNMIMGCPPDADAPVCEKTLYPAAALDLGKAVLTIRENAEMWGVDTARIAVCGFSAGGHNCAMYATGWHLPELYEKLGCTPEALRPAAAILCYGALDFEEMFDYTPDERLEAMNRGMNLTLLGERLPDKARLRAISPTNRVTENTPPCFLWATAEDQMVPVSGTLRMAMALAEKKVPFELHVFEKGRHALSTASPLSAGHAADVDPDVSKWVPLAEAWLRRHMPLPLG